MLDAVERSGIADLAKSEVDVEEALIWTYRQQRAGAVTRAGIYASEVIRCRETRGVASDCYPRGFGLDSVVRVQRNAASAPAVERMAQWATAQRPHADAEAIDEAVRRLTYGAQKLLMAHGRGGSRPEWDLPPEFEPALGWRDSRRQWGIREELESGIRWTPIRPSVRSLELLEHARQAYLTWHDGLRGLVAALQGVPLARYVVIGPRAPRYPWRAELDSEGDRVY